MSVGGFLHLADPRVGLVLLCAAIAGCGGSGAHPDHSGRLAEVNERDFHITAPTHLVAGPVTLRVRNEGPDQHELIIVPAEKRGLPLRHDGLTVSEEILAESEPGSLVPGQPGTVRYLHLDLAPGRYTFFCNMEGHYMGGMHQEVIVG